MTSYDLKTGEREDIGLLRAAGRPLCLRHGRGQDGRGGQGLVRRRLRGARPEAAPPTRGASSLQPGPRLLRPRGPVRREKTPCEALAGPSRCRRRSSGAIAAPASPSSGSTRTSTPHRLDYRDLGYPTQNLIPADESRITALLSHSNGFVYGATSGRTQSYLFFFNRFIRKARPLGRIAQARGVHHALLEGKDGSIYIGTGLNVLAPVKLTAGFPVAIEAIEHQLWKDIQAVYQGYEGGHIYRYDPKTGDTRTYTNDDPSPLEDLGIPVPGNTVYAMTWSPDKTVLYGLSYPDAHFFIFDLATRKTRDLGDVVKQKVFSGPERDWRTVPRALYCDPGTGRVYSSGENGLVWRYDPATGRIEETNMRLPGEYYESLKSIDFPVFECFDTDGEGRVYAGTNDGFLVRLDLEQEKLVVLGKPRPMRRMRAMKVALDGRIYMLTGELDRICKLTATTSRAKRDSSSWASSPSTAAPTTPSAPTRSTRWRSERTARSSWERATAAASSSSTSRAPARSRAGSTRRTPWSRGCARAPRA